MTKKQSQISGSPSIVPKKPGDKAQKKKSLAHAAVSDAQSVDLGDEYTTPPPALALAFSVLSKEDSEELLEMCAVGMECKLQNIFQLNPGADLKEAAVLDYYVGATHWSKEQGHSAQQLSGLFTVIHTLLNKVKDQNGSLVDTFLDFRKMLVGISADVGPGVESGGLEFFSSAQAKTITKFLHVSLFQHFKLFEYMFSHAQPVACVGSELSVEVPLPADTPFPPPLDEGISEATYTEFLSLTTSGVSSTSQGEEIPVKGGTVSKTEYKPDTSPELPAEAMQDIFSKLSPEDVQEVVSDVAEDVLQTLRYDVEHKMRQYETSMLARINKIRVVLPETLDADVESSEGHK